MACRRGREYMFVSVPDRDVLNDLCLKLEKLQKAAMKMAADAEGIKIQLRTYEEKHGN